MDILKRVLHACRKPLKQANLYAAATLAIVAGWLCWNYWIAAVSRPLPNVACIQDLGVMVDAGYRFYQGLRVHADYHSPFGPVLGMLFGMPMVLGGPTYASFRYLPATVMTLVFAWTWCACGYSLGLASRAVVAMAMGVIAGGIYHQGFPPEALTFATFYNRVAFGILGIIALCCLLPREADRKIMNGFRDSSVVAGVIILGFLKAVFAAAAIPFVVTTLLVHQRKTWDYLASLIVGCLLLAVFLGSIGFRIDRMWADLLLSAYARAQNGGTGLFFFPIRNALANIDFIFLAMINGMLWIPLIWTNQSIRSLAWGVYAILMPSVVGWGLTLIQSHGDGRGISLLLSGMAASCAWIRTPLEHPTNGFVSPGTETVHLRTYTLRNRIAAATLCLAAFLFVIPHVQSLLFLRRISSDQLGFQFQSPPMRDLLVGPYANELGPDCIAKMNEGIDLINRHCEKDASLQYMGGANIYSFACGLRSPRDSMLFWCSYSSYTAEHHPPASDFADTEYILMPKASLSVSKTPEDWREAYSYYFGTHFTCCEETSHFVLYKRKVASRDGP